MTTTIMYNVYNCTDGLPLTRVCMLAGIIIIITGLHKYGGKIVMNKCHTDRIGFFTQAWLQQLPAHPVHVHGRNVHGRNYQACCPKYLYFCNQEPRYGLLL